jgi:hypothetical protein
VRFGLDELRAETTGEEAALAPVPFVERLGVGAAEEVHALRQLLPCARHQQMEVRAHLASDDAAPAVPHDRDVDAAVEVETVDDIPVKELCAGRLDGDVIDPVGQEGAKRSGHAGRR